MENFVSQYDKGVRVRYAAGCAFIGAGLSRGATGCVISQTVQQLGRLGYETLARVICRVKQFSCSHKQA